MITPTSIQGFLQEFNRENSTISEQEKELIEVVYIWYTEGFKILHQLKGIEIANKAQYLEIQEDLVRKYDLTILSLLGNTSYREAFDNLLQKLKQDDAKSHLENLLLLSSSPKSPPQ